MFAARCGEVGSGRVGSGRWGRRASLRSPGDEGSVGGHFACELGLAAHRRTEKLRERFSRGTHSEGESRESIRAARQMKKVKKRKSTRNKHSNRCVVQRGENPRVTESHTG